MKHWVQLLAIANCRGSSARADSSELAQLTKKVADQQKTGQVTVTKDARHQRRATVKPVTEQ